MEIPFQNNNKKRKIENLALLDDNKMQTGNLKPAIIPKRNGGAQEVNLATIMEVVKNTNQQQNQRLSSEMDKIMKKLDEQNENQTKLQQVNWELEQKLDQKLEQVQNSMKSQLFLHHAVPRIFPPFVPPMPAQTSLSSHNNSNITNQDSHRQNPSERKNNDFRKNNYDGKRFKWNNEKMGQKRCYKCGSSDHLKPNCPYLYQTKKNSNLNY